MLVITEDDPGSSSQGGLRGRRAEGIAHHVLDGGGPRPRDHHVDDEPQKNLTLLARR
jgi:hypothetical protein